jgi:hypothetical protein
MFFVIPELIPMLTYKILNDEFGMQISSTKGANIEAHLHPCGKPIKIILYVHFSGCMCELLFCYKVRYWRVTLKFVHIVQL